MLVAVIVAVVVALVVGVGVVLAQRWSNEGASGSPTPAGSVSVSATPDPTPAPRNLRATATAVKVTLRWAGAADDTDLEYRILRDDVVLAIVDSDTLQYVDDEVDPGTRYRYAVVAWIDTVASDPVVVAVKTEVPPVSQARLLGVFDVRFDRTSTYGISDEPERTTAGWRFRPECETGPCDVSWKDIARRIEGLDLKRDGARYSGSGSGQIGFTCGGTPSTANYSVSVRVVSARVVNGRWRATRIEATWSYTIPVQLGCRSGGTTWEGNGLLVT